MDIQQYISSGIIETYVMGLCSPAEEKELEQLRQQYPELDKAIIAYEDELEKNLLQHSTLPDAATDSRILNTIDSFSKPAPIIPIQSAKRNWLKPFAIAASVLLFISAGLNYYLLEQSKKTDAVAVINSLPLKDYEVMKNPRITPVAMYGVGYHAICRCTMFWDKSTGKMYIMIHHLPQSSSTKDYQLWAMVDGKPVSVGIIQDEIRGRFIEMNNVPAGANAFIVTLENAGGSTNPTEAETYLQGRI
ncbi:MAG: anti-sigma factor [Chitinophagaceae bacterium]